MSVRRRGTVRTRLNKWSRRLHRWLTVAVFAPLLLVIATGLLLQIKKDVPWVQPPTARGSADQPRIDFETILRAAASVPRARVSTWADIDRLDVRPERGIVKVQPRRSRWEVQIDLATGEVLHSAYRRSDLIESLHDGSFFGSLVKSWVFLPSGVALLGLWLTGVYLWMLPYLRPARRRVAPGGGGDVTAES